MGELRLYAIGVDEVRDVFCASPALEHQFRSIAAEAFPAHTTPKQPGMLGKLGPLFRRPPEAVIVQPDTPVEADVAELGKIESFPRLEGRQMVMMIGPK